MRRTAILIAFEYVNSWLVEGNDTAIERLVSVHRHCMRLGFESIHVLWDVTDDRSSSIDRKAREDGCDTSRTGYHWCTDHRTLCNIVSDCLGVNDTCVLLYIGGHATAHQYVMPDDQIDTAAMVDVVCSRIDRHGEVQLLADVGRAVSAGLPFAVKDGDDRVFRLTRQARFAAGQRDIVCISLIDRPTELDQCRFGSLAAPPTYDDLLSHLGTARAVRVGDDVSRRIVIHSNRCDIGSIFFSWMHGPPLSDGDSRVDVDLTSLVVSVSCRKKASDTPLTP